MNPWLQTQSIVSEILNMHENPSATIKMQCILACDPDHRYMKKYKLNKWKSFCNIGRYYSIVWFLLGFRSIVFHFMSQRFHCISEFFIWIHHIFYFCLQCFQRISVVISVITVVAFVLLYYDTKHNVYKLKIRFLYICTFIKYSAKQAPDKKVPIGNIIKYILFTSDSSDEDSESPLHKTAF